LNRGPALCDYWLRRVWSSVMRVPDLRVSWGSPMRKLARKLALLAVVVACAFSIFDPLPAHAQKKVALVIGNDDYKNIPALKKAGNDARKMGETLGSLGFEVIEAHNQTRRQMSESLLAFDRSLSQGDIAFFFFAGHGFEIQGENYLLPVDVPEATEGQEELVRDASFAAQRVIDRLQARGVRTSILVLDACRNNPFERPGKRSVRGSAGLAPMTPNEGVFVIFSAGAKQAALDRYSEDDQDPNSVFTRHFVKELSTPGLTLVQVAKRTQAEVKMLAAKWRHDQTPAYYDQIVGDVVLNGTPDPKRQTEVLPQIASLPAQPLGPRERFVTHPDDINAPIASFMRHNGGWSVTLSFADPVTAISWRMGESGNFKETGFLDTLDPRTRKRMPNPSIQLDADTPAGTIYVRAADLRGNWSEPLPVRFNPVEALEKSQRQILEMTSGSWLSFREYNGLMIYWTHLASYRCAIREVRVGFDTTVPDRKIVLPPCDMRDPVAIPHNAQTYLKLPSSTKVVSVELTYKDGSVSETKTFRADTARRN
jgi:hypothetical protein